MLEAAKRKFGPGDVMWTCSGGTEAVGNHTLAEGLGLGRGVVGVFCARHDRTLREVAEDMTRRELDPSGTRLASAEEPAPLVTPANLIMKNLTASKKIYGIDFLCLLISVLFLFIR